MSKLRKTNGPPTPDPQAPAQPSQHSGQVATLADATPAASEVFPSSPIAAWLASRPDLAAAVNASGEVTTVEGIAQAASDEAQEPEAQRGQLFGNQAASDAQQTPGNADSDAPAPQATQDQPAQQPTQTTQQVMGNVPAVAPAGSDNPGEVARVRYQDTRDRLMKLAEWPRILETVRNMRKDSALAEMKTEHRERFIWSELDRLYPPLASNQAESKAQSVSLLNSAKPSPDNDLQSSTPRSSGTILGLSDLPKSWPELPGNASLAAEVGWVQAERLRIVEEKPGSATVVTLGKARSPAPSWSALSWLETSIRSYAKFVEVAAKVASAPDDEQAQAKRERMAIEEIRSLLAEMLDSAGN